jgi:Protein of unknown function (DUF4239)
MATVFWGVFVIALAIILAIMGQALVQRLVPVSLRESHNVATGTVYAPLYAAYGLILGFSLLMLREQNYDTQKTTEQEANQVKGLYQLAKQLPEPNREQIQDLTESYARVVVDEEWPMLGQGTNAQKSPQAEKLADDILESVNSFSPSTSVDQARYSQALTLAQNIQTDRALRLAVLGGLPTTFWVILVMGAVLIIVFALFLGMNSIWLHRGAVAGVTTMVVLILYVLYVNQYPFSGVVPVKPYAFETALQEMDADGSS